MTAGADYAGHAFEHKLRELLSLHGHISEGRVYLFSLSRVKKALGDDWDRLVEKVHATAQAVIGHRLSEKEFFIRYDDTHYVVAFDDLDEARARIKLALIAQEIGQRLLGAALSDSLIDVRTAEVGADGQVTMTRSASVEALVREQGASMQGAGMLDEKSPVQFIFRPLWFVKKRVITNYLCIPVTPRLGGGFYSGYEVLNDSSSPERVLELDLMTLKRVAEELARLQELKLPSLVSAPVHFETLAVQRRGMTYAQACDRLLAGQSSRLVLEMVGLPEGIPQSRIQSLAQVIRPHARSIMARFGLSHRAFAAYHAAGLSAVGVDIYGENRQEKVVMREMEEFVEAANRNGLHTYAHGLRSLSLNTAAICAGFDYVDGYAISTVEEGARDIHFYDIRQPYDRQLAAGEKEDG